MRELSKPQFYKDLTRKTTFFAGWSWFKFNNLRLTLNIALKFYTSVTKGLKLKVRKFWRLILTFVKVTREKLVLWRGGGLFASPPPPPLPSPTSWVKYQLCQIYSVLTLYLGCKSVTIPFNSI